MVTELVSMHDSFLKNCSLREGPNKRTAGLKYINLIYIALLKAFFFFFQIKTTPTVKHY